MKPFNDLTDQEIVSLTDEQIARYIDLACAEAGVPFLPEIPSRPTMANDVQPDRTVHTVGGIHFDNPDDAEEVAALIAKKDRWAQTYENIGGEYGHFYKPTFEAVRVTTERIVTSAYRASKGVREAAAVAARQKFTEDTEEYERIAKARNREAAEIHTCVETARGFARIQNAMRNHHARYLELAGGRRDIAAKFFAYAYPDAKTILPEAFENLYATVPAVPAATQRSYEGDNL